MRRSGSESGEGTWERKTDVWGRMMEERIGLGPCGYGSLGWVVVPCLWSAKAPVVRDWKKLLRPDLRGWRDDDGPRRLLGLYAEEAERQCRAPSLTGWYLPLNMPRGEDEAFPVVIDSEGKRDADRGGWPEALRIGWDAALPCWRSSGTVAAGPAADGGGRLPNMMLLLSPAEVRFVAGRSDGERAPANLKLRGAGEVLAGGAGVNLPPSTVRVADGRTVSLEELVPCPPDAETLRARTVWAIGRGLLLALKEGVLSGEEAGGDGGDRPECPWLLAEFKLRGWDAGLEAAVLRVQPGQRWYATKTIAAQFIARGVVDPSPEGRERRLEAVLRVVERIWDGSPEGSDPGRVWRKALEDEGRYLTGARR